MKDQNFKKFLCTGFLTAFFSVLLFSPAEWIKADNVSTLQQQETAVKNELDQNNDQLAKKVNSINDLYQKETQIKKQQQATTAKIKTADKKLDQAKTEKKQRVAQAKQRLRELQQKQGTQNTLKFLESSQNFSQWVGNVIALGRLQAVYDESFTAVKQSIQQLKATKLELAVLKGKQDEQQQELAAERNSLNHSVESIKKLISNDQGKISLLANKVTWAKDIQKKQQAAAQVAAQATSSSAAAQSLAAASASSSSVNSSSSATTQTQADTKSTSTTNSSTSITTAQTNSASSQVLTMQATGYSTAEKNASAYSALGINLKQNPKCVAVDPSVIPLGSLLWVSGYGVAIAGDTGGAIKGKIIDLHFSTVQQAVSWGRRTVTVKILN